jgi:hypothetical protein
MQGGFVVIVFEQNMYVTHVMVQLPFEKLP